MGFEQACEAIVSQADLTSPSKRNETKTLFIEAMASCTAITKFEKDIVGDPLDVRMFEATKWVLRED